MSEKILPSTNSIIRSHRDANRGSWVTIRKLVPLAAFTRRNKSKILSAALVSRLEELDLVRSFFLSAVSFANKPDVVGEIVSNNSDYSIYKALKQSIEEGDMAILSRSLTSVSDKSAFAVFAFLYPNEYSLQPASVIGLARLIFQDVKDYSGAFNVEFESLKQKIIAEISLTNQLFCQHFQEYGFESPLEFSVIIGILYRNVYHQKLEQNDAAGKDKDEKFTMRYFSYIKNLLN